jgi:integrase
MGSLGARRSLTLAQAKAVLTSAEGTRVHAYVVLSILVGARTEELRALTWDLVDLDGDPSTVPPRPPSVRVWRSVGAGGDTKTKKSRRTLALPKRCVDALRSHRVAQRRERERAGGAWQDGNLVFASLVGCRLDAANVGRAFRSVLARTDLNPKDWTPRDLRHSFVWLLSSGGVSLEEIADLCGHFRDHRDAGCLPARAASGVARRCGVDGHDLRRGGVTLNVSHSVSHPGCRKGRLRCGRWPLSWWAILGSNQ